MVSLREIERIRKKEAELSERKKKKLLDFFDENEERISRAGLSVHIFPYGNANITYVLDGRKPRTKCLFDGNILEGSPCFYETGRGHTGLYTCPQCKIQYHLPPTKRQLKEKLKREAKTVYN